jgi:hypothetical protein
MPSSLSVRVKRNSRASNAKRLYHETGALTMGLNAPKGQLARPSLTWPPELDWSPDHEAQPGAPRESETRPYLVG